MINYIFEIDVKGEKTKYSDVVFTSGDIKAARLTFSFKDGKEPFLAEGLILMLKAKRADGVIITDSGFFDGERFYIDIKNSMTAVPGELSFEVALTDSDGAFVTVSEIICTVRKGYGEADLKATDTVPVLATLSSRVLKAETSALNAEKSAEEAALAAESMENELSDLETALDSIIAIQNSLIGGENV